MHRTASRALVAVALKSRLTATNGMPGLYSLARSPHYSSKFICEACFFDGCLLKRGGLNLNCNTCLVYRVAMNERIEYRQLQPEERLTIASVHLQGSLRASRSRIRCRAWPSRSWRSRGLSLSCSGLKAAQPAGDFTRVRWRGAQLRMPMTPRADFHRIEVHPPESRPCIAGCRLDRCGRRVCCRRPSGPSDARIGS
jgi:hypothetical protein